MTAGRLNLENDWYLGEVPNNVTVGSQAYIDSSYAFAMFLSEEEVGLTLGEASGAYNRTSFVVGPSGTIEIGAFSCLNNSYLICNDRITIGNHCLLSWGVVVTDTLPGVTTTLARRRRALREASTHVNRWLPPATDPEPVTIENNVWIGFDAVIYPGVTLGRGCIIGCKTIVTESVPPYAVAVGDPVRIVRYLDPDDSESMRSRALKEYIRANQR